MFIAQRRNQRHQGPHTKLVRGDVTWPTDHIDATLGEAILCSRNVHERYKQNPRDRGECDRHKMQFNAPAPSSIRPAKWTRQTYAYWIGSISLSLSLKGAPRGRMCHWTRRAVIGIGINTRSVESINTKATQTTAEKRECQLCRTTQVPNGNDNHNWLIRNTNVASRARAIMAKVNISYHHAAADCGGNLIKKVCDCLRCLREWVSENIVFMMRLSPEKSADLNKSVAVCWCYLIWISNIHTQIIKSENNHCFKMG